MSRVIAFVLRYLAIVVMFALLGGIFYLQWNAGVARDRRLSHFVTTISRIDQRFTLFGSRLDSVLDQNLKEYLALKRQMDQISIRDPTSEPMPLAPSAETPVTEPIAQPPSTDDLENLPSLPDGIRPEAVVAKDIGSILEDPELNPKGKQLSRIEGVAASAVLTQAQCRMKILESEISVAVTNGVEKLREKGAFIDYAKGEKYDKAPGVVTAGEATENGLRMFYLYPEEFPEVYDKKTEKKKVAEAAARQLVSLLSN